MAQSNLPLAVAGTFAFHLLVGVGIDIASVMGREEKQDAPMKLGLVKIDTSNLPPPPPPPTPPPELEVPEPPPPVAPPPAAAQPRESRARTVRASEPPPINAPPPSTEPSADPGGGPVVHLPGIAPAATGVAVGSGPTAARTGRGGKGRGTGEGEGDGGGSGSAPAPVVATSIASIKTPAEAKDGFDYFDARKSYPPEARRLGIEGRIRVRLLVDATGKVTQAKLLGSLGHGLDELALSRARAIQFTPARDTDDKPVASTVIWTFTFTLPADT